MAMRSRRAISAECSAADRVEGLGTFGGAWDCDCDGCCCCDGGCGGGDVSDECVDCPSRVLWVVWMLVVSVPSMEDVATPSSSASIS
jgi:hypothetical protein